MDPFRGPPAKSLLGRHRVLSPSASVRVSPLFLGTSVFGFKWNGFLGTCTKESAFAIMDAYYSAGGNVIDTANYYNGGESEEWVGEWLALRKNRDDIVLASKYSSNYVLGSDLPQMENTILSNYGGNSTKSLKHSVEASLAKLGTTYLDILYVHWWDFTTSPEELMRSLNRLVLNGTVLYLGASDMPAWFVVKCNAYARHFGLAPFVIYTGKWSVAERDLEREILDMCAAENMAVAPWEVLGGGRFKSAEQLAKQTDKRMELYPDVVPRYEAINVVLNRIASAKSTLPTSVALAYVMQKQAYVFPLVGTRKVEYLLANIEALKISLDDGEIREIQDAWKWTKGFPYDLLTFGGDFEGPQDVKQMTGIFDYVAKPVAIRPKEV